MKQIFKFILSLSLIVSLFSCNDYAKLYISKTKYFPIKVDLNGTDISTQGKITATDLRKLIDIPPDAMVSDFNIIGFTLDIQPLAATEADYITYTILFSNNEGSQKGKLASAKVNFVSTGQAFNISKELNKESLALFTCILANLVKKDQLIDCSTSSALLYDLSFSASDNDGNSKIFNGNITGYLKFYISYYTCEELPRILFQELEKCK